MSTRLPRWVALVGGAALAFPTSAWSAVTVDGQNIKADFGASNLLATQRLQTGFGNDTDGGQYGFGSELNQLYATNDNDYLYLGITGNLENNGNCVVVFIDANGAGSGANFLLTRDFGDPVGDLPRYLGGNEPGFGTDPGFDNIQFEAAFSPDFALGWSGGSPVGSQTRTYYAVNWTTFADNGAVDPLAHDNEVAGVMTAGDATASGPAGTLGSFLQTSVLGILAAADNSNDDGVSGGFPSLGVDDPNCLCFGEDPSTADKGFEAAIPLSELGVGEGDTVCVFAIVSSASGFISNQMLPPPASESPFNNIGLRNNAVDTLDFNTISGNQYACYTLVAPPGCDLAGCEDGDLDGDCIVGLSDLSDLLENFGCTSADACYDANADIDGDGTNGLSDLSALLEEFGTNCNNP